MGICKLCLKEKKLLKKSHIISKLLFKDLFEYNPRKSIFQFDIINSHKPIKNPSDTLYDNGLFCAECDGDNCMAKFEDYFKKYINNPKTRTLKKQEFDWIIYTEYDYDKFFLFFNIQIYRASLSGRNEFKMVEIDEKIIEKIRVNIVSGKVIEKTNEIAIFKLAEISNYKDSIGSFRKIGDNYFIIFRDLIAFYFFDTTDDYFFRMKGHIIKRERLIAPIIPKKIEQKFMKSIFGIS